MELNEGTLAMNINLTASWSCIGSFVVSIPFPASHNHPLSPKYHDEKKIMTTNTSKSIEDLIPEWQDDVIMSAMFAAFPASREINPTSWDAKIAFWIRLITSIAQSRAMVGYGRGKIVTKETQCHRFIFNPLSLETLLTRKGCKPLALATVMDYLKKTNVIIPKSKVGQPVSWTDSVVDTMTTILNALSIGTSSEVSSSTLPPDEEYVWINDLEETAKRCVANQLSAAHPQQIIPVSEMEKHFNLDCSKEDAQLLLLYMKGKNFLVTSPDEKYFKMILSSGSSVFTNTDIALVALTETKTKLSLQITYLQEQIDLCIMNAKKELSKQNKIVAFNHLKRKNIFLKVLLKRMASLETLEILLLKIEDITLDKEVIQSLSMGSASLQELLSHPTLKAENVDSVMQDVQDSIANAEEVSNAIHLGNQDLASAAVDNDEIEEEYAALLTELMPEVSAIPVTGIIQEMDQEVITSSGVTSEENTKVMELA